MGKAVFTPLQQNWKFFENNSAEPSVQLASENVKPTLPDNTSIFRLRLSFYESGGAGFNNGYYKIQHSENESDWTDLGSGADFNYANGLATEDNNITGHLTSDGDALGPYRESVGATTYDIVANDTPEFDFAIVPTGTVNGGTTYYFRLLTSEDGVSYTEVPLNTSETHPQVLTATTATPKSVSDSGSGSDAIASIKNSFTISETGSGVDAIVNLLNSFIISETGSGSDALILKLFKLVSDVGSGSDIVSVIEGTIIKTIQDAGVGVDAITLNIAAVILDSGSGNDSLSLSVTFAKSDTGSGVDIVSVQAGALPVNISDAGTAADAISMLISALISDSGVAGDTISLSINFTISDTGSGADIVSVQAGALPVNISDTGTAADAISMLISALISDSGIGSDILSLNIKFTLLDTGSGVDAISIEDIAIAKNIIESGSGIDAITEIINKFTVSEIATGIDSTNIKLGKLITDLGLGTDGIIIISQGGASCIFALIGPTKTLIKITNKTDHLFLSQITNNKLIDVTINTHAEAS